MRPVLKGAIPQDSEENDIIFSDYARSRRYLIDRIGEYCSYCERKIEANLAVEHVQPKDSNPTLRLKWSNFLLGCTNCNSTKGKKPVTISDFVWPDLEDTFQYFSYDGSGIVNVSAQITDPALITRIQNTLDLVGLQKHPPRVGSADWERASDRRYEHRIEAWATANDCCKKYGLASPDIKIMMIELFKTIVQHQGFWSIWMTAFETFPEVQLEILTCIKGTNINFFSPLPTA